MSSVGVRTIIGRDDRTIAAVPRPPITLVAAVARDGGIGRDGALLVRLPGDLPRLKALTMGAPIVMGRKTWDSIGRPLPGRRNIVVTRQPDLRLEGAETAPSLDAALGRVEGAERAFVLGGGELYALALPLADRLELTEVDAELPADTFFPRWPRERFREVARVDKRSDDGLRYAFVTYDRLEPKGD